MRALVYLEWSYARNNAAAIFRSPGRLTIWGVYALSIALFAAGRLAGSHSHGHAPVGITHGNALAFVGVLFVASGISIVAAAGGRAATFRSPAEAILLSNAGLRPLTIALWLQLRRIAASWTGTLRGFLYAFLIFVPSRGGPLAMTGAFVATTLVLGLPQAVGLPAFLIARGRAKWAVGAFGWLFVALGALYAVAGAGGPRVWRPLLAATGVDPARVVGAALASDPRAFGVPLSIFAVFVAIVAWRGNDALPELYAASLAAGRRTRAGREAARAVRRRPVADAVRRERVLPGASAILWKDWIVVRRNPRALRLYVGGALVWLICGAGAAGLTLRLDDPTALGTFATAVGLVILFWAPFSAATGLADDLAKPLFWLSTASLRTRLAVWAFARTWRGGTAIGCGAAAAAVVLGEPLLAVLAVPAATLAYWSLNALGIGMYAVFPSPLDARGPSALLRFVARFAYLAPAALLAAAAAFAHANFAVCATAFAIGLTLEGWLVIELVALRFTEFGATLATLSRAK